MAYEEHKIQKSICELLHYQLPPDATYFACPNGGSRSQITTKNGRKFSIEGKRLRDEGVVAGVADLMIVWGGRLICWEIKTPKGRQSTAQKEWEKRITECGAVYAVIRSVDEAKAFLEMIGCKKPSRLGSNQENDIDAWLKGEAI
jgi:hypothetical protein